MKVYVAQVEALVPGGDPFNFQLPEFPGLILCLNCGPPDAIVIARDVASGDIVTPPPVQAVLAAMRYVRSPPWAEGRSFARPVCIDPPIIALAPGDRDLVDGAELLLVREGEWKWPAEMHPDEFPVERWWAYADDGRPAPDGDDENYELTEEDIGRSLVVWETCLEEVAHSNTIGPVGRRVL